VCCAGVPVGVAQKWFSEHLVIFSSWTGVATSGAVLVDGFDFFLVVPEATRRTG
jgi:hypothetical protein